MTTHPTVPLFGLSHGAWLWLAVPLAANVGLALSVLAEAAPGLAGPPAPKTVARVHASAIDGSGDDAPVDAYAALVGHLPPLTKAVTPTPVGAQPGGAPAIDIAALFAGRADPRAVAAALDAVTTEELGSAPPERAQGVSHLVVFPSCRSTHNYPEVDVPDSRNVETLTVELPNPAPEQRAIDRAGEDVDDVIR
ncbi:MAG: hypothetical protein EXR79_11940 [Myxococcales bacterium]|nr:hypothetical protein [Myxococcales bacterium]